ncbi:MAG: hypothetical protein M3075_10955 [Candidatus Dormibacteraeota bacterium]|nr:hypothetical protein [Candidatus Dormibacteraeota bacterium]
MAKEREGGAVGVEAVNEFGVQRKGEGDDLFLLATWLFSSSASSSCSARC